MPRSKPSDVEHGDKVLVGDAPKRDSDEAKSDGAMERPGGAEESTAQKEVRAAQSELKEGQVTNVAQPIDPTFPSRYTAMLAQNRTRSPTSIKIEEQAEQKQKKNAAKRS